ncbi:hypothetical protein MUK42_14116 [Musa troglodytarum]|uniref:Uncharacterized protein n=1 Tax=Musa troglodytarum TaxID=320322 RepID=A0A9E7IGQ5_9LILI|nr:hypothetical protein MUK42_14116 [Musa troglodytarum]
MKDRRRWNRTIYRGPSPRGSPSHQRRRRRCREWVDLRGSDVVPATTTEMSRVDCSAYFPRSVNDFRSRCVSLRVMDDRLPYMS